MQRANNLSGVVGCFDIYLQPNEGANERQHAQVIPCQFLVARKNAAVVFHLAGKVRDQVAPLESVGIWSKLEFQLNLKMRSWNDGSTDTA